MSVKVFEDFTALDLVSGGRAEIAAGRGAYTESFPLFGHDLAHYDDCSTRSSACSCKRNRAAGEADQHHPSSAGATSSSQLQNRAIVSDSDEAMQQHDQRRLSIPIRTRRRSEM